MGHRPVRQPGNDAYMSGIYNYVQVAPTYTFSAGSCCSAGGGYWRVAPRHNYVPIPNHPCSFHPLYPRYSRKPFAPYFLYFHFRAVADTVPCTQRIAFFTVRFSAADGSAAFESRDPAFLVKNRTCPTVPRFLHCTRKIWYLNA